MAEDMGFFADRRQRERRRFSGWHVLVLLGLVSRKPMANGLQLTTDCIGGVVLGYV
jgi:hypothetical protein